MRVALIRCSDYEDVQPAIRRGIRLIEPKIENKVLLKPNLLGYYRPEKGVTTHPAVVEAVLAIVKEEGAEPTIADSPGSGIPHTERCLKKLYKASGMNLEYVSYDTGSTTVFSKDRRVRFNIIKPAAEADLIINIPKLKTHIFTILSCAVKNLFGLIPGLEKVGYHTTLLERYDFSTMLFELADLIDPKLNIVDGIIGMEQDGPVSGALRRVGWIIVSDSPVLADIAVCKVIGWDLSYVPALSERAHIGDEAEWLGDDIEPLSPPFSLPSTFSPWRRLARFIKPLFTVQPVPSKRCDGCGLCADVCPRSAISIEERAEINDNACIRCYCCYELCPNQAIVLKRSFANKMVSYLSKKGIWPR